MGETKNLCEWADKFGIARSTLSMRLRKGWSVEKALETKAQKYFPDKIDTAPHYV